METESVTTRVQGAKQDFIMLKTPNFAPITRDIISKYNRHFHVEDKMISPAKFVFYFLSAVGKTEHCCFLLSFLL